MDCLLGYGVVTSGEAFKTSGVGVVHFSVRWLILHSYKALLPLLCSYYVKLCLAFLFKNRSYRHCAGLEPYLYVTIWVRGHAVWTLVSATSPYSAVPLICHFLGIYATDLRIICFKLFNNVSLFISVCVFAICILNILLCKHVNILYALSTCLSLCVFVLFFGEVGVFYIRMEHDFKCSLLFLRFFLFCA